jgi:hypothetical protein
VAPHVIGQQRFIIRGEGSRNGLSNVSLARGEVDPKRLGQGEQVSTGMPVTFGKLIHQLLDAGGCLGDDFFLLSLP